MEFSDVVRSRRSVREYADEDVTRETVEEIIEEATLAPSSYNLQPWEFLVVTGDDDRERLREIAYGQPQVTDAPVTVAVLATLDPGANAERVLADQVEQGYKTEAAAESTRESIERKRDDPEADRRLWARTSTSLAAAQLMLAARARGLGTCPMGGFDADALREAFAIPAGYDPVMLVTIGVPADDAEAETRPRKFRRPVEEVAHFGSFDAPADAAGADDGVTSGTDPAVDHD